MCIKILAIVCNVLSLALAQSLDDVLFSQSSFSILRRLLHQHDLLDTLGSRPNSTFFAMTDHALIGLADFGINLTTADPMIARAIMFYALLDGVHTAQTVGVDKAPQVLHSVLRPPLFTNVTSGAAAKLSCAVKHGSGCDLMLETGLGARTPILKPSLMFDNGMVHAIDSNMVLPHNISETGRLQKLSAFADLITKAGMLSTLDSLVDATIFIPEDDVINSMKPVLERLEPSGLTAVIQQHAVPNRVIYQQQIGVPELLLGTIGGDIVRVRRESDGNMYVNDKRIVRSDILTYGGVVHTIDGMLTPADMSPCRNAISAGKLPTWMPKPHVTVQQAFHPAVVIILCLLALFASNYRKGLQASKAKPSFERSGYSLIISDKV